MRYHLPLSVLALLLLPGSPSYAVPADGLPIPLFSKAPQLLSRADGAQRKPLSPGMASVVPVQAYAASLTKRTEKLLLPLPLEQVVRRDRSYSLPGGAVVWEGSVAAPGRRVASASKPAGEQDEGSVILIRNGEDIHGKLYVSGKLFLLRPAAYGAHELVELDRNRLPPAHPPVDDRPVPRAAAAVTGKSASIARRGTAEKPIFINLMVNYTPAVLKRHARIHDYVDLLVAETNQGFFDSGVYVKLVVMAQNKVEYKESGRMARDLANYQRADDGQMDEIHAAREAAGADLSVLLVDDAAACGLAAAVGADASTAFAVVSQMCATGGLTFGHELGHLFGARHDPETDSNDKPYAHGHGYQFEAGGWHTIMAYSCRRRPCEQINRWSNPRMRYKGQALGTVEVSDNSRVLNERAAEVAAIR